MAKEKQRQKQRQSIQLLRFFGVAGSRLMRKAVAGQGWRGTGLLRGTGSGILHEASSHAVREFQADFQ